MPRWGGWLTVDLQRRPGAAASEKGLLGWFGRRYADPFGHADAKSEPHIALWMDSGDARLRPATRTMINTCWQEGGEILLSAVSAWEIALLVDTGRINLDVPVETWIDRFVSRRALRRCRSVFMAARAYRLQHLVHRDPGDRLLNATCIELGCPLVTYDAGIENFARMHGSQYGFAARN